MYNVSGYWAASNITGTTEAISRLQENTVHAFQRPDADYVALDRDATSLSGHAGSLAFGKISGERTRFNSFVGFKSPGFDSNDLGFMRRADEKTMNNWFQYRDFVPGKYIRTWMVNLNQWAGWNFGGDRLYSGGNLNAHATFANYYNVGFGLNGQATGFRDRITRGGPGVRSNPNRSIWYYGSTDTRKALSFSYNGYHERDGFNTARNNISPGLTWRATSAVSTSAHINYQINKDDSQWVANRTDPDGRKQYVFGRIDQKTLLLTLRFNYTMTPNLSLQVYGQPFVSAGEYSNFKELVDGRAPEYADRFRSFAYSGNPDFNYRSFRTTNVLRWEYKPGSALFVVWQQGRSDNRPFGSFDFSRDFGGVFSAPSHNAFLVKFSYWLNR